MCAVAALVLVCLVFLPFVIGLHRYATGREAQESGVEIL